MLSVGPDAPRFSPSQNIRVINSALPTVSVMYITDNIPETELRIRTRRQAGGGGGLSSRIVFLLSRIAPSSEGAQETGRARSRPTGSRRDDP